MKKASSLPYKLSALLLLYLFSVALAQGAVGVQPPAKLFTLAPGESATFTVDIDNPSPNPLQLSIYPEDWEYDPLGKITFYPAKTLPESLADWITFTPASLPIAGNAKAQLSYTVQVPEDATPGTHWAVLFVEGENPEATPGNTLAAFRIRTGHIIYVDVPPTEKRGEIAGMDSSAPANPADPYQIAIQYLNSGNSVQVLSGRVEVRSLEGERIATIPVDGIVALPGYMRSFVTELYGPLPAGDYLALAVLNYGDPNTDVAGEYIFTLEQALSAPTEASNGEAAEEDTP